MKQTGHVVCHGGEKPGVVENSGSNRGVCVINGAYAKEVGNHWIDCGSFLEVPSDGRCIVTSYKGSPLSRWLAYVGKGTFMKDKSG